MHTQTHKRTHIQTEEIKEFYLAVSEVYDFQSCPSENGECIQIQPITVYTTCVRKLRTVGAGKVFPKADSEIKIKIKKIYNNQTEDKSDSFQISQTIK